MSDKLREAAQAALLALKCLDGLECAREEIENLKVNNEKLLKANAERKPVPEFELIEKWEGE